MGKARDEAGNIWETDAQGKPVRLLQAGHAAAPNVVVPAAPKDPPAPTFVPGRPGLVYNPDTHSAAPLPGVTPDAPPGPTFVPGKPGVVVGPGNTATPLQGVGPDLSPQVRAEAIAGYSFAKQLQDVVDDLNTKFTAGPGQTHGVEGFKDYLPYTTNQQLDVTANKARGIIGQTLGFTGGQLNTQREAEAAIGPFLPQAGDRDAVIKDKIQALQALSDNGKAKAIQVLGGEPDQNGNIRPIDQSHITQSNALPSGAASGAQMQQATGNTRDQIDPALRATGQKLGQMVAAGVGEDKIVKFLQDSGVDPTNTNIRNIMDWRAGKNMPGVTPFKEWQRKNPGSGVPIGPQFYTKQVPMSDTRSLFNKTAATDIGGSAAAGLAASANAISGGRLDNLSADPEMARTGMEMLRANHPASSFVGDLAGQASVEALANTIPGARAITMSKWGRRGLDLGYGSYSGSGENDEDPLMGALTGGTLGAVTGMFGRGTQRGLGRAATGIQDKSLGYLNARNVPMSVGRIARGANNDFGKAVGGIEDRIAGLPGMDAVIGDVRQQGDRAFSREAFNQIDPSISKTGHEGLAQAYAAEEQAYSKLNPVRISVDHPFENALNATEIASQRLRHHGGDVTDVIKDIRDQVANGEMKGSGYQAALQVIRRTRATLKEDVGGKAEDALNALEQDVMDLGARQGGQIGQDLSAANQLHGRIKVMEKSLKSSVSQRAGEVVPPNVLNAASIANTEKFGGIRKALSPDRPFFDLTQAGLDVMPTPTPDSGTAGRLAVLRGLGTAGGVLGGAVGYGSSDDSGVQGGFEGSAKGAVGGGLLAAALMAPYSKMGQKAFQKALLAERPEAIQKLGKFLIKRPRGAGMFAGSAGRDYFFQPELEQ